LLKKLFCFSGGEFKAIKEELRSRRIKLVLKGGTHKAGIAEQGISEYFYITMLLTETTEGVVEFLCLGVTWREGLRRGGGGLQDHLPNDGSMILTLGTEGSSS
jgi:hypothetical protein